MNIWIWLAAAGALILLSSLLPRRKPVTWISALHALGKGPLQHIETIPAGGATDGWPERVHLGNGTADVVFFETLRVDDTVAQTLSLAVHGERGGIIMTFVDRDIVAITKNGLQISPTLLKGANREYAHTILGIVRSAAGSRGVSLH